MDQPLVGYFSVLSKYSLTNHACDMLWEIQYFVINQKETIKSIGKQFTKNQSSYFDEENFVEAF